MLNWWIIVLFHSLIIPGTYYVCKKFAEIVASCSKYHCSYRLWTVRKWVEKKVSHSQFVCIHRFHSARMEHLKDVFQHVRALWVLCFPVVIRLAFMSSSATVATASPLISEIIRVHQKLVHNERRTEPIWRNVKAWPGLACLWAGTSWKFVGECGLLLC